MTLDQTRLVGYYRVSTTRQGASGLGLEAQRAAALTYAASIGSEIGADEIEVESGKHCDRPRLRMALDRCKATGATLVVARIDRLARNLAFLSALMDSGVPFVACDNPNANRLTVHILAAVAEAEGLAISARTKAALAARRARGLPLGGQIPAIAANLRHADREKALSESLKRRRENSLQWTERIRPVAVSMLESGMKLASIAQALTEQGFKTRAGGRWTASLVCRLLKA